MTGSLGGAWDSQGSGEFTRVACRSFSPVREAIAVPTWQRDCIRPAQVLHRDTLVKLTGSLKYLDAVALSAFSAACARDIARKDNILQVGSRFQAESLCGKRAVQASSLLDDNGPAATDIAVNIAGDDC